jgi:hypothetical protein
MEHEVFDDSPEAQLGQMVVSAMESPDLPDEIDDRCDPNFQKPSNWNDFIAFLMKKKEKEE